MGNNLEKSYYVNFCKIIKIYLKRETYILRLKVLIIVVIEGRFYLWEKKTNIIMYTKNKS